jgi:hypothetical protein
VSTSGITDPEKQQECTTKNKYLTQQVLNLRNLVMPDQRKEVQLLFRRQINYLTLLSLHLRWFIIAISAHKRRDSRSGCAGP